MRKFVYGLLVGITISAGLSWANNPHPWKEASVCPHGSGYNENGLTKRELIAAMCLQGLLSHYGVAQLGKGGSNARIIAATAWIMAAELERNE